MNVQYIDKQWVRTTIKICLDIAAFSLAFLLSHLIRFSFDDLLNWSQELRLWFPVYILIRIGVFYLFRLYSSIWRYTGLPGLSSLIKAASFGTLIILLIAYFARIPSLCRSVLVLDWMLVIFLSGGVRISIRRIFSSDWRLILHKPTDKAERILVYGAGQGGEILYRNIQNARESSIDVVGFIDDDPKKRGQYLHNKHVFGDGSRIGELVQKYHINGIYISIPSLSGYENRRILESIRTQISDDIEIKTIPGLMDLMNGTFSISHLRNFEIKDLLRRKPVELDFTPVKTLIKDKTVLVVGGGGSIGSELCYQITKFEPSQLIILDNGEYNLYSTEAVLLRQNPACEVICLVANAANEKMMRKVFAYYQPDLIFHAAAYKHVPLMEMNPWAATHNNITSTMVLAGLSGEYNVERFILISTDKAVQPTSVMGATKRICEQISQIHNHNGVTKFITVRFGNVLGSSGSVIPKFKMQIEAGGPITVTHPEISRYFMLISEAVELVLQAASIGDSGNIYVLDMGDPIKIVDLAKYLIELYGLKPEEDIKIEFMGMRPGEKLRESLYLSGEESATQVPNLLVLQPKYSESRDYLERVNSFVANIYTMNHTELRAGLKKLVPGYTPSYNGHTMPFTTVGGKAINVNYGDIISAS